MQASPWMEEMYTGYEPGIGHGFGVEYSPRMGYGFEKGRLLQIDPLWLRNLASLGQMDWMSDARQWGYPGGAPVPFSMVPRNIPVPPAPPPPVPPTPPPTPTPTPAPAEAPVSWAEGLAQQAAARRQAAAQRAARRARAAQPPPPAVTATKRRLAARRPTGW